MAKTSKLANKASDLVRYRPKPTINVDAKDLPEVKNWKLGETVTLTVTAKVKSLTEGDGYDDYPEDREDKTPRARLTITKISEK